MFSQRVRRLADEVETQIRLETESVQQAASAGRMTSKEQQTETARLSAMRSAQNLLRQVAATLEKAQR